jgi:hypothetical protein
MVNDADDRSIDGRSLSANRLRGGTAFDDYQYLFVYAGAHRVNSQKSSAARRVLQRNRLDKEELGAFKLAIFLGRDDGTYHTRERHCSGTVSQ